MLEITVTVDPATAIGAVAALLTSTAFVPQLFKIGKYGNAELSTATLTMNLAGLALWLVYGIMIEAAPVIGANIVSIAIMSAVVVRKRARAPIAAPRRPRIAIDMDEVMADALGEHLRRYNAAYAAAVTAADLTGRHLEEWAPPAHREAIEGMLDASFFADLAVMPDAVEVIRELCDEYDVYIVTAAMDVPCSFEAKYQWLRRHFPFIPPANIVFCGDKHVVDADYLIDDRPRHFARFKGRPLLYSAPHNAHETRYTRVRSWREVREFFYRESNCGSVSSRSSRAQWWKYAGAER